MTPPVKEMIITLNIASILCEEIDYGQAIEETVMQTVCTSEEIDKSRAFLQDKQASRESALDECYGRALDDFNRMTTFIIETYNPKRIWQWGSLLNRKHFSELSDIDMAVEGLHSYDQYAAILADLSAMTSFPLDVVEMERIGVANANHIRKFGRMVYERDGS